MTQQKEPAKSVKLVHLVMAYAEQGDAATAHRWFDTSKRWTADFPVGNVELMQIRGEEPPPQLNKCTYLHYIPGFA